MKISKTIISGLVLIVFAVPYVGYLYNQKSNAGMIQRTFDAECRKQISTPVTDSRIPALLNASYGKSSANIQPITRKTINKTKTTQKEIKFDFDTYAKSWDQVDNGQTILQKIKLEIPNIVDKIYNIFGEPTNDTTIRVVLVDDLEYSQYNEYHSLNVGGLYRPDLDLILLDSQNVDKNSVLIHEMVHSFSDGSLLIESYEEGIAEATSLIARGEENQLNNVNYSNLANLASPMGMFRTISDYNFINASYDASAKAFIDLYRKDNQFIKNFREKIKNTKYYQESIKDPNFVAQRLIVNTICAQMMFQKTNYLDEYLKEMQNAFETSVLEVSTNKIEVSDLPNSVTNPILNINPEDGLYVGAAISSTGHTLDIYTSNKRGNLLDLLLSYYAQSHELSKTENTPINLQKIIDFSRTIDFNDSYQQNDLINSIDSAPDLVEFSVNGGMKKSVTNNKRSISSNDESSYIGEAKKPISSPSVKPSVKPTIKPSISPTSTNHIITAKPTTSPTTSQTTNQPYYSISESIANQFSAYDFLQANNKPVNFTGIIDLKVKISKLDYSAIPKQSGALFINWPDGFYASPRNLLLESTIKITFNNGLFTNVTITNTPSKQVVIDACVTDYGRSGLNRVVFDISNNSALRDRGNQINNLDQCKQYSIKNKIQMSGSLNNCKNTKIITAGTVDKNGKYTELPKNKIASRVKLINKSNTKPTIDFARMGAPWWRVTLGCE